MKEFKLLLNEISQAEPGDKTLRVDEVEVLLTRYNGASKQEIDYDFHKDSYVRDKNNEIHGTALRKLSMVIFLNDNIDEVYSLPDAQKGMLRLYNTNRDSV